MGGLIILLTTIIYIAVLIYLLTLLARLVSATERISQDVEVGVAAWTENLRQQSGG